MTAYDNDPVAVARRFSDAGATHVHLVDLEGAKNGGTPNIATIESIRRNSEMVIELGGGIRDIETVKRYIDIGVDRVILGTAAVTDRDFLCRAIDKYGKRIAVGVDIKDGYVAIKGWVESSQREAMSFCRELEELGVSNIICTDISKDGAMSGTNLVLYEKLYGMIKTDITASGGVSSIDDVKRLRRIGVYGAIIGKAYYTGAIDLKEALEAAK